MRRSPRFLRRLRQRPDVTIGHDFRPPPYGGSNQFLLALRRELERRGLRVGENVVGRRTRAAVLNSYVFDAEEMRRGRRHGCRMVHRVDGPLRFYRGYDDGVDERIANLNRELADATVFQSEYSLRAHHDLGLELVEPVVIPNAVDPEIFHPPSEREPLAGRRVRVVATSWSDNPRKGGETYAWLATHVDRDRYELTFVGRASVPVEADHVLEPLPSAELAQLLRRQDVYVTASLSDPCSNALLEALACSLPALFVRSGGHAELVGDAGFGYDEREEVPELLDRLVAELEERRARISIASLAEVTDRYLDAMAIE
jgi:glycosyltransferase involved in cell wall biosynthesis